MVPCIFDKNRQNLIFTSLPSSLELSGDLQTAQDGYEEEEKKRQDCACMCNCVVCACVEERQFRYYSLQMFCIFLTNCSKVYEFGLKEFQFFRQNHGTVS